VDEAKWVHIEETKKVMHRYTQETSIHIVKVVENDEIHGRKNDSLSLLEEELRQL
jgi:hypothetical protein